MLGIEIEDGHHGVLIVVRDAYGLEVISCMYVYMYVCMYVCVYVCMEMS